MPSTTQTPDRVQANVTSEHRLLPLVAGAVVLLMLVGLFLSLFINKFAGLFSGDGEFASGVAFLHNVLPYRDYFCTAPPLNILKSALLLKIFGQALIVSRVAGLVERLFIGIVLFAWLVDLFAPWQAVLASAATMILSSGDHADPIASYNHDSILFAILCGFSARLVLKKPNRAFLFAGLSGMFAAASFLTKQTVGLGALVGIGGLALFLIIRSGHSRRTALHFATGYVVGVAIPVAIVSLCLGKIHVLNACFRMLFVSGPAAKAGSPIDFLIRSLVVAILSPVAVLCGAAATALTLKTARRGIRTEREQSTSLAPMVWCLLVGIAVIVSAKLFPVDVLLIRSFSLGVVYFVFLGITIWLCLELSNASRVRVEMRVADCLLLMGVGWVCAATLSLSWPTFEAMELPGFAILAAAILGGTRPSLRWIPVSAIAALVFFQTQTKLAFPFNFAFEDEAAVANASSESAAPGMAGIRMAEPEARLIDDTVSAVAKHTTPSDHIFTYPEMAVLYAVSNRYPPTRALSQNIDTLNDTLARQEAKLLISNPPAVIVYAKPTDTEVKRQEAMWRNGKPSGQRDIVVALDSLLPRYDLLGTYALRAGDSPIRLYVRRAQ